MALTPREAMILCVLLLCVPIQLWMTKISVGSSKHISDSGTPFMDVMFNLKMIFQSAVSPAFWVLLIDSAKNSTSDFALMFPDDHDPQGECPAAEVRLYKSPEEHYAASPVPRRGRHGIKFKVGQMVRHMKHKYTGIVIGWDRIYKGTAQLSQQIHDSAEMMPMTPHYLVLISKRHLLPQSPTQSIYLPQDALEASVDKDMIQAESGNYFSKYDGAQFIMQPWLRALYPRD